MVLPDSMKNPVKPLPYTEGALDTYAKYGCMMFPQQQKIYAGIKERIGSYVSVLEVGCGIGLGTALLDRGLTTKVIGTDNLKENVKIAKALYPWIRFEQWDVCIASSFQRVDTVVAVEVLEHVTAPITALRNMCAIADKEVWLSTPNGRSKKRPPENPYHVLEYHPYEILSMIGEVAWNWGISIHNYDGFGILGLETTVDPLVYHLTRGKK